jgi:hypothetical protein
MTIRWRTNAECPINIYNSCPKWYEGWLIGSLAHFLMSHLVITAVRASIKFTFLEEVQFEITFDLTLEVCLYPFQNE